MEATALQMFDTTVKYSGQEIFIKPVCDFFKIEYDNQLRRINSDPILRTSAGKNPSMLLFGDTRPRVTLTVRGFVRWIQLLNPQIVQVSLREKLITYQVMIFDYLFKAAAERKDIEVKNARLVKLKTLYSRIGNEIQILQKDLTEFVHTELRLDMYKPKKA